MKRARNLVISIPIELRDRLVREAKAEGRSLSAYATQVFEAAVEARCTDERAEGGTTVAAVMLLEGSRLDRDGIAKTLGLDIATVDRIVNVYRGLHREAA